VNAHARSAVCRDVQSLPPISIIFFNNSLRIIPAIAHLQFYKTVSRRTSSMVSVRAQTFIKPLRPQRDHALFDRLLLSIPGAERQQNQFAELIVDFHDS